MPQDHYALNLTAENLRILLNFLPVFLADTNDAHADFLDNKDELLDKDAVIFSWCHLYELPIQQHLTLSISDVVKSFETVLEKEKVGTWFQQLVDTPGQVGAIPQVVSQIDAHFDSLSYPSKEATIEARTNLPQTIGLGISMVNTFMCVLYHGCFLNEMIERVRNGDDKALFDAIRIDSTVVGCISISNRISKAALLKDNRFFAKLKSAINGKLAKRDQANFQKMRLVLEVLQEAGATRLSDSQLKKLFIEELDLYTSNSRGGGSDKALRKFADTYMKKNATT